MKDNMAAPAPWDSAAPSDQLFVLVTGANSGIGLGIGQRLMDEFVARRPDPGAHLVLVTTTRSAAKSRATTAALRRHLARTAAARPASTHPARVHLASVELDLCRLPTVAAAAARLGARDHVADEGLTVWSGVDASPVAVARLPRLDAVVCNAGIGGWTGVHYGRLVLDVLRRGYLQATTFPGCKLAAPGLRVDPRTGRPSQGDSDDSLGEVFCANVFGHYVLVHALLPLLRRTAAAGTAGLPPARIVWESSVEAVCWRYLAVRADGDGDSDSDDLQGVRTTAAYESSKRLTDVLALTAALPAVAPVARSYWGDDQDDGRPRTYLSHPGVVCSTLFPLPALLFYAYVAAMYVARWCGSPWHPVTAYRGAAAAVWLALQPQAALDALDAQRAKWGAGTTAGGGGIDFVKRSEVEGWGWGEPTGETTGADDAAALLASAKDAGRPEAAAVVAPYLDHSVGRRHGDGSTDTATAEATAEQQQAFEALGRRCWQEMERLRTVWAARVPGL